MFKDGNPSRDLPYLNPIGPDSINLLRHIIITQRPAELHSLVS